MTPRLSKSRIQSGRQCHKRLWLEIHDRDAADWGEPAQSRLDEGIRFGELARELLGGGLLIESDHLHFREALAETRAALSRPRDDVPTLFEAAFEYQGVRVRLDALRRRARGDVLIEVKSTTSVKDEHVWDCAIQTWVARGAGREIRKVLLAHVDKTFVYAQPGNYDGLLTTADITSEVYALQDDVGKLAADLKRVAAAAAAPAVTTGVHCSTPYECPFLDHCRAAEPPPPEFPVELLPRARALVERLRAAGYRDLREVPGRQLPNALHKRIAAATRHDRVFVSGRLRRLLASVAFPRYYLDFETASFVIPRWLGTRPFQALPFQFSCHRESATGELEHSEFLDVSGDSPLAGFVDRLLEALQDDGPIMVWSKSFEASRLAELGKHFPRKRRALERIADRMVDLLPIYREHYYHRDMRGSWSIKAVLPTVAAELSYGDLAIGGGTDAQMAYLEAINPATTEQRRATLRSQLSAYCGRDTLALHRLMSPIARGRPARAIAMESAASR